MRTSIETMPYFLIIWMYVSASALPDSHLLESLDSFLKSRSYYAVRRARAGERGRTLPSL